MKKKVVSLLLVTTMVASLAAGCGDSSSSGDGKMCIRDRDCKKDVLNEKNECSGTRFVVRYL